MIIQKLNELVAGEPIENMDVVKIATQFARDPMNASLFNHASMAHNNHFFYEALSTAPLRLDRYPNLKESLEQTFGSIETLRITMLDTAAAMFGPGFVWLVWARDTATGTFRKGDWRILTTYLAGTPYPEAGYRQQGIDMNNNNALSWGAYHDSQPVNHAGSFGAYSKRGEEEAKIPPGGTKVMPVLCVNTWEHVYVFDYGLPGKRKYLSDWWDAVDWDTVNHRAPSDAKASDMLSQGYA
jgi:Fe-Mn family superoxide dismutase